MVLALCLAGCATQPVSEFYTQHDDSDTVNPLPAAGSSFLPVLNTFLGGEDANRSLEYTFLNFVSPEANSTACLGSTLASLTMNNITACVMYNAGYRGTETGSITFPNNSTCWVAADENTTGGNAGIPNFTRAGSTHYLIDCIDVSLPAMAFDTQALMKVVTVAGSVTAVTDLRNLTPFPATGSGAYPSGNAPELTGYAAANTPEAETITGAITFSRSGSHAYTAALQTSTCTGQWIDALASTGVGTCSSTVLSPLTTPQAATLSSSTYSLNATNGSEWQLTVSHNVTITLTGCSAGQHLFIKLSYTGAFTPVFAAAGSDAVLYNTSGAPTFTAANTFSDIIGFSCQSNGSGINYDALPASLGYTG